MLPRYNLRTDEDLQAFQTAAGLQEEGGRGNEGEGEDDDIEMVDDGGQRWASEKCPVSMKEVRAAPAQLQSYAGRVGYSCMRGAGPNGKRCSWVLGPSSGPCPCRMGLMWSGWIGWQRHQPRLLDSMHGGYWRLGAD